MKNLKPMFNNFGFRVFPVLIIITVLSCYRQPKGITFEPSSTFPDKLILSESQIQLANIKMTAVDEGALTRDIEFTGMLRVNDQSITNISSRSSGRIQKVFYKNTGETVNKGDSLYEIYSDELVAAEREYFTLQSNNWNFSGKYEPSLALENKLLLLGMLPSQIEKLKKDGKILFTIKIHSPLSGIIKSVNLTEGEYVADGQNLFELAKNNDLWVDAQVYPDDIKSIKVGMPSLITIPAHGSDLIKSRISFINPSVEPGKNMILIRSKIENPERDLFPGMLAIIKVQAEIQHGLVIPVSALLTDSEGNRVWVNNEDGSFSARNVITGLQSEDSTIITSGLTKMEMVVTSGAYLLDSELILKRGTTKNTEANLLTQK